MASDVTPTGTDSGADDHRPILPGGGETGKSWILLSQWRKLARGIHETVTNRRMKNHSAMVIVLHVVMSFIQG